jgi:site-specific DNA-methyltransferase (adenine-specific)
MKFDVIIGNPPYQLNDGGSGNGISAKPLYHLFVTQSKKLFPSYLLMIIPSRWFAGGKGLDEFRHEMLNDSHIHYLIDYPKSRECFPNVDIAGGVCYFLWERNYKGICTIKTIMNGKTDTRTRRLNEFDIFIRDNMGLDIIHKIRAKNKKSMASIVYSRNPFGFVSSARGSQCHQLNSIKLYSSAGWGFVNRNEINKNNELIPNYKVFIGKVNPDRGGVNNASDKKMNVTTRVGILNPDEIMTETYLLLQSFENKKEAENCASFYKTKFVRFLISQTITSMNITKDNFQFVPLQDFSEPWTDEKLYKKYNLTQEEINFIESMIRPME